jgi:hypothetical protein
MRIANTLSADDLFIQWKEARADYELFSDDGILQEEAWKAQRPKIAFILKESNDGFYNIRGRAYTPGPGSSSPLFWRNLNIWSYTVKQFFNGEAVSFSEALSHKNDLIDHIAYVNLKKKAECRRISNDADIQGYVDRDWQFIDKQLSLIDPDIFFCCGTYKYIKQYIQAEHLGLGVYTSREKIVIDFYHPSGRASYRARFERLSDMLKNLPATPS